MRKSFAVLATLAVTAMVAGSTADAATKTTKKKSTKVTTTKAVVTTTAPPATTAPPTTVATTIAGVASVEGCEKAGYSDPKELALTRTVARCEKGSPAPKPLKEKVKLKVATSFRLEFNSPLLLADSLGEFAKENIEVEFVTLSFANAVPQLATGTIDAAVGGIEVALFNAGFRDLPVKAVLSNYFPPRAGNYRVPQTGLWCRRDSFAKPSEPNLREVEVMKWGTSVGRGSVAVYYSVEELRKRVPDFDIKRVEIAIVPSADTVTALKNKAIDCGILLDPIWLQVANDSNFVQVATQTPGEPLGIYAFGKNLLQDRRDVGEAFARAFVRTVNTYFNGDYHEDAKLLAEIARVTNLPTANLKQVDSLVMDWEFRAGTATRIQQLFIDLGVITDFKSPVPEDKIIDRSFYEKAVGARK